MPVTFRLIVVSLAAAAGVCLGPGLAAGASAFLSSAKAEAESITAAPRAKADVRRIGVLKPQRSRSRPTRKEISEDVQPIFRRTGTSARVRLCPDDGRI